MKPIQIFFYGNYLDYRLEITFYQRLKQKTPIKWIDISLRPDLLKIINKSTQEAQKTLFALDQNETLYEGLDAFCLIWETIQWLSWIPKLVRLPLVYQSCWIVYTISANMRFRLYRLRKKNHQND
ncbi:hypothetical protein CL657_05160 [bacterium]|nr:hypothetical protein [bacterium]|tara:strand:- start:5 stop:379 length:375 start_codon:yes stop_codon:yes gene_type:complete